MKTQTLNIAGMSCEMCVSHVTRALQALDGVQSAEVSLANNQAVVTYNPNLVGTPQMQEAVAEEGYEVTP